jgi:hypothetical protein
VAVVFNDLDVAVHKRYLPNIINQVFKATPLLVRLIAKNSVVVQGGYNIRQPILYGELPGGSFSGSGPFDVSYRETHAYAEWEWKNNYVDVTIPGTELAKADSDIKIVDLLNMKMDAASRTMKKILSTQIYGDGTGNAGQDMDGLKNGIDDGTNYAVYGGIDRSVKTWWKANVDYVGGAFSLDMIQNMYGKCIDGDIMPDLIICSQSIWDKFWSRLQPQQRFMGEAHADIAAAGFTGFEFNRAVVVADNFCPEKTLKILNTDYIQFVINSKANFLWTPPKSGTAEWAYVRQLIVMANLIVPSPWRCGVITNIT